WIGLPALAKWSRNGMAAGSSDLVPEGTVGVFDRPEQLAALSDEERDRLRAVILSHDNDPIAALRPELIIREPDWLRGDERGRNVPDDMSWLPSSTFWQVLVDAANAMKTIPGEFGSFGHDYRADLARFVRDAFHLPATEAQTEQLEEALVALELERRDRLRIKWDDPAAVPPSARFPEERFAGGVPLDTSRTRGARWFG
ncbi:MAG: alpha/beta-hydrolase family protein, partial [Ilumatobacteraceae bacterium]